MGQGGIPAWAVPGAKVVALYDFPDAVVHGFTAPKTGSVYTIREIDKDPGFYRCIRLVEITNGTCNDGWEPSWVVRHFRPLIERTQEQDVARFRKHLHPKRIRTDAIVKIPHHGLVS